MILQSTLMEANICLISCISFCCFSQAYREELSGTPLNLIPSLDGALMISCQTAGWCTSLSTALVLAMSVSFISHFASFILFTSIYRVLRTLLSTGASRRNIVAYLIRLSRLFRIKQELQRSKTFCLKVFIPSTAVFDNSVHCSVRCIVSLHVSQEIFCSSTGMSSLHVLKVRYLASEADLSRIYIPIELQVPIESD